MILRTFTFSKDREMDKRKQQVDILGKIVRMRKHTLKHNKQLKPKSRLIHETEWLEKHYKEHKSAWLKKGASKFISKNYSRIKFIATSNGSGDSLVDQLMLIKTC